MKTFKDINSPFGNVDTYFNAYGINPYWIINNARTNIRTDVFTGSFNGTLKPTPWLDASYRLSYSGGTSQSQFTRSEVDFSDYALANGNTVGGQIGANVPGAVQNKTQFGDGGSQFLTDIGGEGPQGYSRLQQDALLNFHHTFFTDFKTTLLLGNTIWQEYANETENSSSNLLVNGFYNIGSILGTPETSQTTYEIRQVAYFGDATIGYKDFAFLEGSLRNDHDSRLSAANRSFFYPSVKGSLVLTDALPSLKDNRVLSFLKLRGSYSQVGDVNIVPYGINNTYSPTSGFPYGSVGGLSLSTTLNNPNLKPEITDEIEFGADMGFWDNRVNASATYYTSKTKNQTLSINTSPATGYLNTLINVGEVENQGYEFKADVQLLTKAQNGVGLDLGGNLTIQTNKVVSLFGTTKQITIGGYSNAAVDAVVGKSFPQLYGTDLYRDPKGQVVVDGTTGYPTLNSNLEDLGSLTPKYIIGLTQTVSYKFVTLTAVSEFRTGDVIYNEGESEATTAGASYLSASAGRERFIFPNSVINTGPGVFTPNTNISVNDGNLGFFDGGAYSEAASTYVTSGAFWKLREADLAFDVSRWTKKSKFIKRTTFSLIGRNLIMLRPKTNNWTDPEFAYSAGNNGIGVNNSNQNPPSRFYGASLNVTF